MNWEVREALGVKEFWKWIHLIKRKIMEEVDRTNRAWHPTKERKSTLDFRRTLTLTMKEDIRNKLYQIIIGLDFGDIVT